MWGGRKGGEKRERAFLDSGVVVVVVGLGACLHLILSVSNPAPHLLTAGSGSRRSAGYL